MVLSYCRSALLKLRHQPVLEGAVKMCKELKIFKFRGTRAGNHVKDYNRKIIQVIPAKSPQKNSLEMCLLNARSIRNKVDELELLASQEKSAVIIITETWLNSTIPDEAFCPTGYQAIRCDREQKVGKQKRGGGVCLLNCDHIQSHRITCHNSHVKGIDCGLAWYRYDSMPRSLSAVITWAIYIPPNQTHQASLAIKDHISLTCDQLSQKYKDARIILAGDFNNVDITNVARGIGLRQVVKAPTRGDKVLDQIWTNLECRSIKTLAPIARSDHATVAGSFDIGGEVRHQDQQDPLHGYKWIRRKKEPDIIACGAFLSTTDWSFISASEHVDQAQVRFSQFLIDTVDHFFPKIKIKVKRSESNSKPWVTEELAQMFKDKTKAYKRNDQVQHRTITEQITNKIIEAKSNYYSCHIKEKKRSDLKAWHRLTTQLGGYSKKKKAVECEMDLEQLNLFFANMGISKNPWVSGEIPPMLPMPDKPSIEQHETSKMLRSIDLTKAQPLGDIPAFVLKLFHIELAEPVTTLFNRSLHESTIPCEWCCFEVIPVPKIKRPSSPEDWRPITVAKILFRLLDKYVAKIFCEAIEPLMNADQYGGRPARSTDHYLISMAEFIYANTDEGKVVSVQTVDLAKAYNSVNHQLLLLKTQPVPCKAIILNWIRYLILHMTQVVNDRQKREIYQAIPVKCGVPQGTSLAPRLFNWFTNDAPHDVGKWSFIDDITTGSEGDDICASRSKSQDKLDTLNEWLILNCLAVNAKKCKSLTFDFKRKPVNVQPAPLTIANAEIEEVKYAKILGVTIQSNLKWDINTQHIIRSANFQMFLLSRLAKYKIHSGDLSLIYKAYIRPKLEYACALWSQSITAKERKQLERIQKRAVTLISKGWNRTYEENLECTGLTTLENRRDDLTLRVAKRLLQDEQFSQMFPRRQIEISGTTTRNANHLAVTRANTERRKRSVIPSMVRLLNREPANS